MPTLTRLAQAFDAMNAAFDANDLERRASTDIDFHQAIGEATHNVLIGHLSAALLHLMQDNIRLNLGELKSIPAAISLLKSQHAAIYAAINERKPAAAVPRLKRISTLCANHWPSRCALRRGANKNG